MSALILDAVSKARGWGARRVQVLREISLAVEAGEVVLLRGPSGSGKTTLLAVAGGLLTPESGRVYLDGHELHAGSRAVDRLGRARSVGFVFQRANLLPRLTVRENVRLMGGIAGMRPAEAGREADLLLESLGLAKLHDRYPRELSCGEEQRVAVARALVHRPRIVLADEPTGNLDGRSGLAVAESLARLAKDRQSAVIVATHDARIATFATRRIEIEDGRLRPAGSLGSAP